MSKWRLVVEFDADNLGEAWDITQQLPVYLRPESINEWITDYSLWNISPDRERETGIHFSQGE